MNRVHVTAGLIAAVVVVYANAMSGAFHYDDFHSLVNNISIRDAASMPSFFTDASHFSADADKSMYRPLVLVSYAVNYAIHGGDPLGFQLLNLLLHLGCVLLVWQVALRVEGKVRARGAVLAALLFAVHPVGSEPVNYVSSRSESLAALLLLLALWLALRSRPRTLLSVSSFCAALLSKATAAALPMLMLTWPVGSLTERARRLWPYAGALIGYVAILGFAGLLPVSRSQPVRDMAAQLATQCKAISYYMQLLIMPVHQSVDPAFAEGAWSQVATWGALVLGLSLLAVILSGSRGRQRWWLLWPVWVALPASAVPLNVLVNEHRIYLASAGLFVCLAMLLVRQGMVRQGLVRIRWRPYTVALVGILAILTMQRNQVWASELTLWSDAVALAPNSSRARVHLGTALREEGPLGPAQEQFERALQIDPHLLPARTNLANLLYEQATTDPTPKTPLLQRAASQYRQILGINSRHREALTNLGNTYLALGDTMAAIATYDQAIEAHPDYPDAYDNLARLKFDMADFPGTAGLLEEVIRLEPGNTGALRRLGDARAMGGDLPGAVVVYRKACRSDRADASACYNLGEALFHLTQSQPETQATRYAQEAIQVFDGIRRQLGPYRRTDERLAQLRGMLR